MRLIQLSTVGLVAALAAACASESKSNTSVAANSREVVARDAALEPQAPGAAERDVQAAARAKLAASKWAGHGGDVPFVVGYDEGARVSKETGKPPMYFFTTTWCGWCRKLASESFTNPAVVELISEKFTPVIVDGDTEKTITRKYGVSGYPKIVFAGPDGRALGSVDGYKPTPDFLWALREAANRIATPSAPPHATH